MRNLMQEILDNLIKMSPLCNITEKLLDLSVAAVSCLGSDASVTSIIKSSDGAEPLHLRLRVCGYR